MTKKAAYILCFALAAAMIFGIVVGILLLCRQDEFQKSFRLLEDGVAKDEYEVSFTEFFPGESVSYTIEFQGKIDKIYDVSLSFREEAESPLAEYLDLEIQLNGEVLSVQRLSEYLRENAVALQICTEEQETATLVLCYTMPQEIGNEAQETTASFRVQIEAACRV